MPLVRCSNEKQHISTDVSYMKYKKGYHRNELETYHGKANMICASPSSVMNGLRVWNRIHKVVTNRAAKLIITSFGRISLK